MSDDETTTDESLSALAMLVAIEKKLAATYAATVSTQSRIDRDIHVLVGSMSGTLDRTYAATVALQKRVDSWDWTGIRRDAEIMSDRAEKATRAADALVELSTRMLQTCQALVSKVDVLLHRQAARERSKAAKKRTRS